MTTADARPLEPADMRLRQFATLLVHARDAIVIVDRRGQVCEWNPAAEVMLGWSRPEILAAPVRRYVPRESLAEFEAVWAALASGADVPPYETVRLHRDGTRTAVSVQVAAINEDGTFAGAVETLRDLSVRVRSGPLGPVAAHQLELVERDQLTGLWGRRGLQRRLAEPVPEGLARAVAMLDVDAFALVNQAYGPDAADDVLRELAGRLRSVAGSAVVGRWQADEFVCVLDAVDPAVAMDELTTAVLQVVREPLSVGDDRLHLTVSAGLATRSIAPDGDLLTAATAALRTAKETGRDRAVWFDAQLRPASGGDMRLANDLHRGIERGELRLYFQPIIELSNNHLTGVEALVRWDRPGVGLLGPGNFIDVAERTGQIVPLGAWVAEQACLAAVDLAMLSAAGSVSINLSARQLNDPGLVDMLRGALHDSGCPAANITIEVTETALAHDMSAATATLHAIKALGVGLDLDDFGTGYSSLLYLKNFPVDRIKIDQSFVRGLGTDADDTAIVASTILLAHSVGLQAVAEGVETVDQLTLLRQMGCDFAQGYLFSRPLTLEQLRAWIPGEAEGRWSEPSVAEERDQAGEQRDEAGGQRDHAGDQRDHAGQQRDEAGDQRDQAGDRRDEAGDQRDQAGDRRDQAGDRRDQAGEQRDHAGEQRDQVGEQRDQAGEQRDHAGYQRDKVGDQRDQDGRRRDEAAEERDQVAHRRDEAGDQRDQAGAQRDQASHRRDQAADKRDVAAARRDQAAEQAEVGLSSDSLHRSALARREAASDRKRAWQDRGAGARERNHAGLDRTTAFADRGAGASERTQAELDRSTALADRGAGATERTQAELDRSTALADRGAGASERTHAEADRSTALADRGAGASERTHAEADRSTAFADRGAGASERTHAELDRSTALADRGAGASERTHAELDRNTALADRGASARERENASSDDLTGVYRRAAGFIELEREIARTRRAQQPLVLAFVDVDRLKAINDSKGHAAGDRMLIEVANVFRAQLRSHDLIIRYGGDEFVCAISGLNLADASTRLARVHAALAEAPEHGSVTIGLAELRDDESPADLVARADAALYRERQLLRG